MSGSNTNNQSKRSFNQMNTELIDIDFKQNKKIVVSKLQTPTKINQITQKTDYDIEINKNTNNRAIDNNLDLFYQENESKLMDLENKLLILNQKSEVQSEVYTSLKDSLNNDYFLKKQKLEQVVSSLVQQVEDAKTDNDNLKDSLKDRISELNVQYRSKELAIREEYQKKLSEKENEFNLEKSLYEDRVKKEKGILKADINKLNTHIQERTQYLQSKLEFDAKQRELGIEINNIRSQNFEKLNEQTEMLIQENNDMKCEIEVFEKNIGTKLTPKNNLLKRNVEKENSNLQSVNETRKRKIEESATLAKQYEKMQLKYNSLQSELAMFENRIKKMTDSIKNHREEIRKKETIRRVLHNEPQDLRGNIRICYRIKPETAPQSNLREINALGPDEAIRDEES